MRDRRHRRPCCLSWSSRLFRVLICARLSGSLGSPSPLCSCRFRLSWRYPPFAVRRLLALAASSPRELRSPSESFRLVSAVGVPTASAFLGVHGPSSRHHQQASMPRESQLPVPFRPRRFSRPRRLSPPTGSWVCFTPQPRPGFALQGFCLASSRADSSSSLSCPLVVGADSLTVLPPPPRTVVSTSGLCSTRESVVTAPAINRCDDSIPS